jgi:hypothetical protein
MAGGYEETIFWDMMKGAKFADVSKQRTTIIIFRDKGQAKQEQTLHCEDYASL